jgi:hypothetical protein
MASQVEMVDAAPQPAEASAGEKLQKASGGGRLKNFAQNAARCCV